MADMLSTLMPVTSSLPQMECCSVLSLREKFFLVFVIPHWHFSLSPQLRPARITTLVATGLPRTPHLRSGPFASRGDVSDGDYHVPVSFLFS